jgi:hypothetical protein
MNDSSNVACAINEDVRPVEATMTEDFGVVCNVQHSLSKRINGIA